MAKKVKTKKNVNDSRGFIVPILLAFIDQYNLVRSRRLDISLLLFGLYGPRFRLGPLKHKKKKKKKISKRQAIKGVSF